MIKSTIFGTQPAHLQRFSASRYTMAGTMICQGSALSSDRMICLISRSVITLHWQTSIGRKALEVGGIKPRANLNVNVIYSRRQGGSTGSQTLRHHCPLLS